MKFPIAWHKEGLKNMRRSAAEAREQAKRAIAEAERIERACIAYDAKIIEAETRGLTEFDESKFGLKKRTR